MVDYLKRAVAFGDLKNSSLYFEHLIPVYAVVEFARSVAGKDARKASDWEYLCLNVLPELLPPHFRAKRGFADDLVEINQKTFNMFAKLAIAQFNLPKEIRGLSKQQYDNVEDDAVNAYFSFVRNHGLEDWPLAAGGEATSAGLPDAENTQPLPLIVLSQLNLVDASGLSWEHVHELRKDRVAQATLRRLRLFAFQNYVGKSRDFVEDDLLARISDYEVCSKKWGLETVQGTLSLVLNSKAAAGAFTGSFVSAAFGQPLAALIAGTVGVALEIGNVALEIQKKRMALEELAHQSPVSFIQYVREQVATRDAR